MMIKKRLSNNVAKIIKLFSFLQYRMYNEIKHHMEPKQSDFSHEINMQDDSWGMANYDLH